MEPPDLLTVNEVAERLGISPNAVRKSIDSGALAAWRNGRMWLVHPTSVERLARQRIPPGRPMSPRMAWALLLLASGEEDAARSAADQPRYVSRMHQWLRSHSLADEAPRLRSRAQVERFEAHPAELVRLHARPDVLATGVSAGEIAGLVGGDPEVDVYAPRSRRPTVLQDHMLQPGSGNVCIRWVPDAVWPLLASGDVKRAPRAAVLLDLLEHDDPRARREARKALEHDAHRAGPA